MDIPIVVSAFNRPSSLKRILASLEASDYPIPVKLYISIDGGGDEETVKIAREFPWIHGTKEVIHHPENLGLRNHILSCGDLSGQHDAIILLEDDLFVSPGFFCYTLQAVDFYKSDPVIGGISLYSHSFNETAQLPFVPVMDGADIFFMQLPSSWGQCYTRDHWTGFRAWYKKNGHRKLETEDGIPKDVANWPDTSWKKYWFLYLIESDKYFVFPRYSLTTNFGDPGVHFQEKKTFQQVPVLIEKRNFLMKNFNASLSVYDAFCEILPGIINRYVPALRQYNYTVDLYGIKSEKQIKTKYILTSKKCSACIFSFGREFKPIEYNILQQLPGEKFCFSFSRDCDKVIQNVHIMEHELYYFYDLKAYQLKPKVHIEVENKQYTANELVKLLFKKIRSKITFV